MLKFLVILDGVKTWATCGMGVGCAELKGENYDIAKGIAIAIIRSVVAPCKRPTWFPVPTGAKKPDYDHPVDIIDNGKGRYNIHVNIYQHHLDAVTRLVKDRIIFVSNKGESSKVWEACEHFWTHLPLDVYFRTNGMSSVPDRIDWEMANERLEKAKTKRESLTFAVNVLASNGDLADAMPYKTREKIDSLIYRDKREEAYEALVEEFGCSLTAANLYVGARLKRTGNYRWGLAYTEWGVIMARIKGGKLVMIPEELDKEVRSRPNWLAESWIVQWTPLSFTEAAVLNRYIKHH